ncbi:hypothetical protein [Chengkuizengella marina]|uniref:Uncharacterized protein n=1 Tax=Chengkuizengella marina TaxID=2507566 RepID=A0A6N9PZY7_9BACL|nr:hypothetical protein [Chengkuizengella marina]NBI29059.1 hypothetical protein [Chengkuizengella marina]
MNHSVNIIALTAEIIAWIVIAKLVFNSYKKLKNKLKIWKVIFVTLIGLLSFTIHLELFDTVLKIPILPLGVWILYGFLKRKKERWVTYRSFAWIGFFANFIFIVSTFIAVLIHPILYPTNQISTYISNADKATIIKSHPSAENISLNKDRLKQISNLKQSTINSEQWYEDTILNKKRERFPYLLVGTSPKWGSGLNTSIHIEADGKGILLMTEKGQLYFRSEHSILEEGK